MVEAAIEAHDGGSAGGQRATKEERWLRRHSVAWGNHHPAQRCRCLPTTRSAPPKPQPGEARPPRRQPRTPQTSSFFSLPPLPPPLPPPPALALAFFFLGLVGGAPLLPSGCGGVGGNGGGVAGAASSSAFLSAASFSFLAFASSFTSASSFVCRSYHALQSRSRGGGAPKEQRTKYGRQVSRKGRSMWAQAYR